MSEYIPCDQQHRPSAPAPSLRLPTYTEFEDQRYESSPSDAQSAASDELSNHYVPSYRYLEDEDEEWNERSERPSQQRRSKSKKRAPIDSFCSGSPKKRPRSASGAEKGGEKVITPRTRTNLLWRKYGQKKLRGATWKGIVRCYYKCYHEGCPAKRLIEKMATDLSKVIAIKFEDEHNHPIPEEEQEGAGPSADGTPRGPSPAQPLSDSECSQSVEAQSSHQ